MNAIKFIQQNGVEKARKVIAAYHGTPSYTFKEKTGRGYSTCQSVDLSELKRLIESVGLINKLGGVGVAKEKLTYGNSISAMRLSYETTITGRDGTKQNVITGVYLEDLEQAIADYEAIHSLDIEKREFELGLAPDSDYVKINDMGDDSHIENHVSPNCKVGVK